MISFKEILKEKTPTREWSYLKIRNGETVQLRIVPKSFKVMETPFIERYVYHTTKGTIHSPMNYGENDPIEDFGNNLRLQKSGEQQKIGKLIRPMMMTYVPVLSRSEGNKFFLWSLGLTTYTNLVENLSKYEKDNPLCPISGFDIRVHKDSNSHVHINVIPKPCKLSYNQNKLIDSIYKSNSIEESFKKYSRDVWEEISDKLKTKYLDDLINQNTISEVICEVTSSIDN